MTQSMLGRWDRWNKNIKNMGAFRYGDTITYKKAAEFLADMEGVEDWGCGAAGFKRFYKGKYLGVDGSKNPFVDKIVDLAEYKSEVDGILLRHVLEHNYQWEKVLQNAVDSFQKKLCLILFTPFVEETKEIAHNRQHGVDVPDLAFKREDIEKLFDGTKFSSETLTTDTGYKVETIYYVERYYG